MIRLQLLPARQGDAIWVRWGDRALTHQLLVDMGTAETGRGLRTRLANRGDFELLVVTHIDSDHIGGTISALVEGDEIPGTSFRDIWFNGLAHARGATREERLGGRQGSALEAWLATRAWNRSFDGEAVVRTGAPRCVTIAGMRISVLGPTPQRLAALAPTWAEAVAKMDAGRRARVDADDEILGGVPEKPLLRDANDLRLLAAGAKGADKARPNGSSIVLLLEYEDRAILLTGDAFASDIVDGIASLQREGPLRLDALKLPHHGSKDNVTAAMLAAVDCGRYLFSTDGTIFRHPDREAVACVIAARQRRTLALEFNARSRYTEWWDDPTWRERFGYSTTYGDPDDGLIVDLD